MKNIEKNPENTPPIFSQEEMDRMAGKELKNPSPEEKPKNSFDLSDEEMNKIYEKDKEPWKN
jgi:hypothetical protein